ncbi:ABC transporter substrate-binding protein [uncultured Robinsoniella sp.]|uniref:ABC transporter substrate-binding protein n=1 Tax=uncultured Robinsoniella sp. TaxID=904190 RepID=UPI00374E54D5
MKKNKIAALALVSVMLCGSLAGCGNTGNAGNTGEAPESTTTKNAQKVNIKLFTGKIETIDVMNEIIDDFNKSQNRITVEQEYQKDASNIIKIKFASNEVPDIMTTYEQGFVDEGKYMDLSDQKEWWDRMTPEMKEACTDVGQGKAFRVCTNMTMAGFFYNKSIFSDLGIQEFPFKWDDFEKVLEDIKAKKPDVVPWFIFGSEAWHLGHLIEFIPHGYIKSTLGTLDAKKAMLDNDQSKLRFADSDGPMAVFGDKMKELQDRELINKDVLTATNDNCVQDFVSGKTAMFSNGMWAISSILDANPDMENQIGFAPYPAYMPDSSPVVLSAEDSGYSISATTEHKEECIEFLNFLFQPENQKKYCEAAKAPSAFQDVTAEWAPKTISDEVAAALKNAVNIGYTNEKPAGFSGDDAGRLLQNLFAGQYTPDEFAKAYAQAWNDGFDKKAE